MCSLLCIIMFLMIPEHLSGQKDDSNVLRTSICTRSLREFVYVLLRFMRIFIHITSTWADNWFVYSIYYVRVCIALCHYRRITIINKWKMYTHTVFDNHPINQQQQAVVEWKQRRMIKLLIPTQSNSFITYSINIHN